MLIIYVLNDDTHDIRSGLLRGDKWRIQRMMTNREWWRVEDRPPDQVLYTDPSLLQQTLDLTFHNFPVDHKLMAQAEPLCW